jgi:hypothetical protein
MKFVVLALVGCIVFLSGCAPEVSTSSQKQEQQKTENQQQIHLKTTPIPVLDKSQERINLSKRLTRFNTDSKVSYIYLINYGKVMAFYTVKGKVSSVNSLLTTPEQVKISYRQGHGYYDPVVISSPDIDGSYGTNGDAVFFFTTDDTYVEWSGDYMLCDKPLTLTSPPEMVISVKE